MVLNKTNRLLLFKLFAVGVLLVLVCSCNDAEVEAIEFWVSTTGSDLNSGDHDNPFRTLRRARDAVRELPDRGISPVNVHLNQGTYRLSSTLQFTPKDSGGKSAPVVYQAVPGADVTISGSQRVKNWILHDAANNIWRAQVETAGTMPRQLYVNGVRAVRARTVDYPNYYTRTDAGYSYNYIVGTDPQIPPTWTNPAYSEAVTATQWKMMRCPVEKINGNDVIMQNDCWKNANVFPYLWSFQLLSWWENAYEFLDKPGEWFLNPKTKTLYYIPRNGENLASPDTDVELPVLEKLIDVTGDVSAPVAHIQFRNLNFQYATWLGPNTSNGYALDQSGFYLTGPNHTPNKIGHDSDTVGIPGNVHLTYAQNIIFAHNTFTHLGGIALHFGTGSQRNTITGNTFRDISAAAIQLGGIAAEDHHPEYPSQLTRDNTISNNLIEYSGQEYYDAPGIYIGFATRTLVEHNEIGYVPWSGIAIGWGWGLLDPGGFTGLPDAVPYQWGVYSTPTAMKGNKIIHNNIHHFLEKLWDGGAIYSNGSQGTSMDDGLLLAWNVVQNKRPNAGANIFYTDGGSRYVTLRQNVSLNNPQGYVDLGPCGKASSFPAILCSKTDKFKYGKDFGGCLPYGDMLFTNNYLSQDYAFYGALCKNDYWPDAPINMRHQGNVKVKSADEVPAWIINSAGRQ